MRVPFKLHFYLSTHLFLLANRTEKLAQIDLIQFIQGNYIIGGLATMTTTHTHTNTKKVFFESIRYTDRNINNNNNDNNSNIEYCMI